MKIITIIKLYLKNSLYYEYRVIVITVNFESHDAAITWVLIAANSAARSPKAIISVGQTNVKSRG